MAKTDETGRFVLLDACSEKRKAVYAMIYKMGAGLLSVLGVVLSFFWLTTSSMSNEMVEIKMKQGKAEVHLQNTKEKVDDIYKEQKSMKEEILQEIRMAK